MKLMLAPALVCLAACSPSPPLPVLGEVPRFQLTSQSGTPFSSETLEGHIWVADFIYTNCQGPCPLMSRHMSEVQRETARDVRLVSFTVDPANDTPQVLAAYSKHFRADDSRWFFLTGEQSRLNDLGLNWFHLNSVDGKFEHSTRFALVDRRRRIRGYYLSSDDGFPQNLIGDLRRLEKGPS
jgi:protein SCO1/2